MAKKSKTAPSIKRAAIYIRVSSEKQADKASPQAQEDDSRAYCRSRGYVLVDVYRDTEKYRSGRRMVEPSGWRSDRPQFRRMLADVDAGHVDVIIAWREDRLYRGFKPMLEITERIEQKKLYVELVKEAFDANLAPVKAWAARQELLAKHDRFMMGFAARLAAGKPWNFNVPYGYRRVNDRYEVEPEEGKWVQQIWRWYAEGISVREIRRRLISAGATQGDRPRKDAWGLPRIRKVLRYEVYYTGIQKIRLEGAVYELPLEPLVDAETARLVEERRARHKVYPVGNLKYDYLAMGLIYCGVCGWRMHTIARQRHSAPEGEYRCPKAFFGYPESGCVRTVGWHKLDRLLWEKVSDFLADDERFEREVNATIEALRSQETNAEAEVYRLREQLDTLTMERQKVITLWRRGKISEDDMDLQMAALNVEEVDVQRELAEKALLTGDKAQKLIEFAKRYRSEIRAGLAELQAPPQSAEDAKRHFGIKRTAVEALVERVDVMPGRILRVSFRLDSHSERQMRNPGSGW